MAIHTPDTTLSANDKRILNALFDPETLPSSVAKAKDSSAIDASLPPHPSISSSQLSLLENHQNDLVRRVDSNAPDVDISTIEAVITELNEVTRRWPNYPSAYINRAMLRRINLESATKTEELGIFAAHEQDIEALFVDLSRAIHVSLPSSCLTAPVSPYQARILRAAFSHRAYLYLKAAERGVELRRRGKSELEELASGDFAAAARYGDEVAREMSVRTNPYAKMCGAIVRNALAEERKEEMSRVAK